MTDPTPAAASSSGAGSSSGMPLTALILGIVAVVLSFIPIIPILSLGLGIAAIVLGIMSRKRHGGTMATVGLYLGIAAVVLSIVVNFLIVGLLMG